MTFIKQDGENVLTRSECIENGYTIVGEALKDSKFDCAKFILEYKTRGKQKLRYLGRRSPRKNTIL